MEEASNLQNVVILDIKQHQSLSQEYFQSCLHVLMQSFLSGIGCTSVAITEIELPNSNKTIFTFKPCRDISGNICHFQAYHIVGYKVGV